VKQRTRDVHRVQELLVDQRLGPEHGLERLEALCGHHIRHVSADCSRTVTLYSAKVYRLLLWSAHELPVLSSQLAGLP
jgi:hypothetical protein